MEFASLLNFVLNWVLYLALFPVAFYWFRRCFRIFIKHDYSEVALKRGESPANPKRWAPFAGISNLVGGAIAVWLIITVPLGVYTFSEWIKYAGLTLWGKLLFDYLLSRQAHPFELGRKKARKEEKK
jgi:hypothetical protein